MIFRQVLLRDFRNIDECIVELSPEVNVVWGDNGEGKTNFLESIYFLSYGRPLRGDSLWSLIRWGKRNLVAEGTLVEGTFTTSVRVLLEREKGITPHVNGERMSGIREYAGRALTVAFQGDDARALFGSPQGRRKMLDQTCYLVSPVFGEVLLAYMKCLRQRNRLLKMLREGQGTMEALHAVDAALVPLAVKVAEKRSQVFARLAGLFEETLEGLGGGIRGSMKGEFEFDEDVFRGRVEGDVERGYTTYGPHRHDFTVLLSGKDGREFASTGQKRVSAIALKLAQARFIEESKGVKPVILLDDITSELDSHRRRRLVDFLERARVQSVVTTTDWRLLPNNLPCGKSFHIQGGKIL